MADFVVSPGHLLLRQIISYRSALLLNAAWLIVVGMAPVEASAQEVVAASRNLALGKRYAMDPAPSYSHCTDKGDASQLTDGVATGCDWGHKSTVGWSYVKSLPTVVIDLGVIEPIDAVRIHTIGGGRAGVRFPSHVLLMVSDDGVYFHIAGASDTLSLVQDRQGGATAPRTPHVLSMTDLNTRGRFVLFVFEMDGPYLFIDEVEVLRGSHQINAVRFAKDNHYRESQARSLMPVARVRSRTLSAMHRLEQHVQDDDSVELTKAVEHLRTSLRSDRTHRVQFWEELDRNIAILRGRWLATQTDDRLQWRVVDPLTQLEPADAWFMDQRPTAKSVPQSGDHPLEIRCWQGEYESAAITLVNASATPMRIRASISPLRNSNGEIYDSSTSFTLRQVVMVESRGRGFIGDALVRLDDRTLDIGPGGVGQLWITFHHPSLGPGTYEFSVALSVIEGGVDSHRSTVDLPSPEVIRGTIRIDALELLPGDSRPALQSCAWAYVSTADLTRPAMTEAVADLNSHYSRVFVFNAPNVPFPSRSADGRMTIDFTAHDAAVRLYQGADQFLFFWGMSDSYSKNRHLPTPMSDPWKRTLTEWLRRWVAHLKELGIGYDQFAMYPYDETLSDDFYELARFIKESVDPKIRIYANSRGRSGTDEMARIEPYIDIWCLPDKPFRYKHPTDRRPGQPDVTTWTYSAASSAKARSPHAYYRLQAWRAFYRGDTGNGFWIYADPKRGEGSLWDDFATPAGRYGVVYGADGSPIDSGAEQIIPSRRWEAWRAGIEDYEYLHRLKSLIETSKAKNEAPAEVAQGERVLRYAVFAVLSRPADMLVVQEARKHVTLSILALETAVPSH